MDICHKLDPDCKLCGKPVYWRKRIFYLDKLWHLDCFKCSKCNVKLNTEVEDGDKKYSKAILGEDYALRCNRCNDIFEQKKLENLPYRKDVFINYYEKKFLKCNKFEKKEKELTDDQNEDYYEYDQLNKDLINYQYHLKDKDEDLKKNLDHQCDCCLEKTFYYRKCSNSDNYSLKDKRCSIRQNCLNDENRSSFSDLKKDFNKNELNTRENLTIKNFDVPSNSLEIYGSLLKESKNNQFNYNLRCNCTGCKEHLKRLKTFI